MIDLATEAVVPFSEAAKHLPRHRNGKKFHVATLHRWATRGLRGVKLETIQVGGAKCTSLEALQRFCERLSDPGSVQPLSSSSSARRRLSEATQKELQRLGI